MKKFFFLLCLPLLFGGCASPFPPYTPVKTGPRTTLTLTTQNAKFNVYLLVWEKPDDPCSQKEFGHLTIDHAEWERTISIPAGQKMSIGLWIDHPNLGLQYGGLADNRFSFIPEENKKYKIVYSHGGIDPERLSMRTKYDIRYVEYDERGQEHDMKIEYRKFCEDSPKDEKVNSESYDPL